MSETDCILLNRKTHLSPVVLKRALAKGYCDMLYSEVETIKSKRWAEIRR